jgi:hypothetical protein
MLQNSIDKPLLRRAASFAPRSPAFARRSTEIIEFFSPLFRRGRSTKQFCSATKPFCDLAQISGNSGWLSDRQQNGGNAGTQTGDS